MSNEAAFLSFAGVSLLMLALLFDVRSKLIKVHEKLESKGPAGK